MNWRLNKIQYPIYNLGPGKRIGIWVQGCNLACEGCINQMLWSKRKGKSIPVYEVFNIIKNIEEGYDGITISGGEPFQQYEQLIAFVYLIKTQTKLNIQCYTGYELNELSTLYQDGLYLKFIDYLVDGRYVQSQHEDENIKGSKNQNYYQIINGKAIKFDSDFKSKKWSVNVSLEGNIYMAGIPMKSDIKNLISDLQNKGIHKLFK